MSRLCFVICVERGKFEAQSLLFVESLRAWGGRLARAPVYAFSPREGHEPTPATVEALGELGTIHVETSAPLNRRFAEVPICNKIYACEWVEQRRNHDLIVWADSDVVVLNYPRELRLRRREVAALRPVSVANAGSSGEDDPKDGRWQRVYRVLDVRSRPFIETAVDRQPIRAYFNSGLIALRRSAGLAEAWLRRLERMDEAGLSPPQIDQVVLAALLADRLAEVRILPASYSYPAPRRPLLPPPLAGLELSEIAVLHYHRWFQRPGFLAELEPRFDPRSPRYRWLEERLPLTPTIDDPIRFSLEDAETAA